MLLLEASQFLALVAELFDPAAGAGDQPTDEGVDTPSAIELGEVALSRSKGVVHLCHLGKGERLPGGDP